MIKADRDHAKKVIKAQLSTITNDVALPKKTKSNIFSKLLFILLFALGILVLITFGVFKIENDFMESSFTSGDLLVYNRMAHSYNVGDIVIVKTDSKVSSHQVIATPGDVVESVFESVFVNHQLVIDNYNYGPTNSVISPYTVSNEEYFILTENTKDPDSDSNDTIDTITVVSSQDILGKAILSIRPII